MLYQSFTLVDVRRDCLSVNTITPCEGSLFSNMSESAGESDCGAHDVVVGILTRLQVNSDVSDKLAVWLSRMMWTVRFLSAGRVPLNVRDVDPFGTEKNVLTRTSLLSPANRKSEVRCSH